MARPGDPPFQGRPSSPAEFAVRASGGRWQLAPHLALLNRFLLDLAAGAITRLLVTMPPRHGKSEFCSKFFPGWFLGTFPDYRVILASYEADFAAEWGGKVRDLMGEFGPAAFDLEVNPATTASARWDLKGHFGGMKTAGVGGPITGKGADLLVIDDPIKNAEEAGSAVRREAIWDWYRSTARTRLEPGGRVLLIQTRWHADDLAGRILESAAESGEPWVVLKVPALSDGPDVYAEVTRYSPAA